jgi:hypothetical protein
LFVGFDLGLIEVKQESSDEQWNLGTGVREFSIAKTTVPQTLSYMTDRPPKFTRLVWVINTTF